jgi:N-acetylglucosamine-6-phosphate deacetylase
VIHSASIYNEGVYYTTDAMAAAGAPPGQYRIGRLHLEVGEDRVVRLPGQSLFAGSALTPLEGLLRSDNMLGSRSLVRSWEHHANRSRQLMKLSNKFEVGTPATFCKLLLDSDSRLISGQIYIRGVPTPLIIPATH